MQRISTSVVAVLACGFAAAADKPGVTTFKKDDLGKVPAGWTATQTGEGKGSVWKVVADASAPSKSGFALAQTAESPGPMFNVCVADAGGAKDVEITVAFKANEGKKDQGGGIVWRYQDANNYYVARFNPLEDNYRLYRVVAGKRTQFGGKEGLKAKAGEWHTLGVKMVGDKITCSLNGKAEIEATDTTFTKAGKLGVWTKADARTSFDTVQIKEVK